MTTLRQRNEKQQMKKESEVVVMNFLKIKREVQTRIKKNMKRGAAIAVAGAVFAGTAVSGNVAHAVTDSYSKETIDGVKPYCKLQMEADASEGTGWAMATLTYNKGGATRKLEASYYYMSGNKKYFTTGATSTGGLSTYVNMKTQKSASVNAGAKSANKVKYESTTWSHSLKVGNPPDSDKGWQQIG